MSELESLELIEQLAYTAGIIDGEGSISILRNKDSKRNGFYYYLVVQVGNTNEWLVLWLQANYGGAVHKYEHLKKHQKPVYLWRFGGSPALELLESIAPYLHIKKVQAEIAIKFQKRRKSYPNYKTQFNSVELVLQEADHILMASLNKRGVD